MNGFSLRGGMLPPAVGACLLVLGAGCVFAQPGPNGGGQWNDAPAVYQRHPSDGRPSDRHWRDRCDFRRRSSFVFPQTSSAWFQRPYPYHLDYYKMRYGGSYAPYFGNLYGPSGFPAYYGPYYGGYGGYGIGDGNGYPPPGYNGASMGYPVTAGAEAPETDVEEVPLPGQIRTGAAAANANGNAAPAAKP